MKMQDGKATWKERLDNHPFWLVLTIAAVSFLAGISVNDKVVGVIEYLLLGGRTQLHTQVRQLTESMSACNTNYSVLETKLAAETKKARECPDADDLKRKNIELTQSNSGLKQDNDKLNATLRKCTSDVNRVNVDNEALRAINKKCSSEIIKPKALPKQEASKPRLDDTSNGLLLYIYDNHKLTKLKIAQALSMTMEQTQYYLDKLYEYEYISTDQTSARRPVYEFSDVVLTPNGRKYVVEQLSR